MSKKMHRVNRRSWSVARRGAAAVVLARGTILAVAGPAAAAPPPTTAFTYQGELRNGGNPVSGAVDLHFRVYGQQTNGSPVAPEIDMFNVTVGSNGRFTTSLDFGPGVFGIDGRWLEIDVRSPAGSG